MLLDKSTVWSGIMAFCFKAPVSLLINSAFKPKLSKCSSSKLKDLRKTCNTFSIISCAKRP